MKEFTYTVTDPLGIHIRSAGLLAKAAKAHSDTVVTVTKAGTTVKASQLMKLMGLGVKQGDQVTLGRKRPSPQWSSFSRKICKRRTGAFVWGGRSSWTNPKSWALSPRAAPAAATPPFPKPRELTVDIRRTRP